MLYGIDVSSHQGGGIQWDQVAAGGISFVIVKATQGVSYVNPEAAGQVNGARAAGMIVAHYHYAEPSRFDAIDEAEHFLRTAAGLMQPGDLVALDYEDPNAWGTHLADWASDWLDHVEGALGITSLFYSYSAYLDERSLHDERLARRPLWLASYRATWPPTPAPWEWISIWQYSSATHPPGTTGDIDGNQFDGTRDDLLALGQPAFVATEAPAWRGTITGREHWGGDPLRVARYGDQLVAEDGRDLTGGVVDDWTTTNQATGQLVIDGEAPT